MKRISINDITLSEESKKSDSSLSFKEKLEIAKLLDKHQSDIIEFPYIENPSVDSLLIRTVASVVKHSAVSVPVRMTDASPEEAWNAVKDAARPRLSVPAPCSTVQMEYTSQKKPAAMLEAIEKTVAACRTYCGDVEFSAEDATRSEADFLVSAINAAIKAGATTVTICDSAGNMMPDEFAAFITGLYEKIPALKDIRIAVKCSDALHMAAACAMAAVKAGAVEVKTSVSGVTAPSTENISNIIHNRGDFIGVSFGINFAMLQRSVKNIMWITTLKHSSTSAFTTGVGIESPAEFSLTINDDINAVASASRKLGYDLSEEDISKVFEAFVRVAEKKAVGAKELDAIIASSALQVPATYTMRNYVINSGSAIVATATIQLEKQGARLSGISIGDGPIDAAFLAIEQIIGRHYELDDFQIHAVTEGREAMGSAIVKLINRGKIYSGHGISTDIIGASIGAYINALNKIVYEESNI